MQQHRAHLSNNKKLILVFLSCQPLWWHPSSLLFIRFGSQFKAWDDIFIFLYQTCYRVVCFWMLFLSHNLCTYNLQHLQNLQQALESKDKNINISHVDLRGLGTVLQGVNLSHVQATGALFSAFDQTVNPAFFGLVEIPGQVTDLSDTNFSNATLISANFAGAILHNINFDGADVAYANFSHADLTGAKNLQKAKNIELARFCDAIMPDGTKPTGSTWTSSKGMVIQLYCAG